MTQPDVAPRPDAEIHETHQAGESPHVLGISVIAGEQLELPGMVQYGSTRRPLSQQTLGEGFNNPHVMDPEGVVPIPPWLLALSISSQNS